MPTNSKTARIITGTSMIYDADFHKTYVITKNALLTGKTWDDGSGVHPTILVEAISNDGKQIYIKAFRNIGLTLEIHIQDLLQTPAQTKVTIRAIRVVVARLKKEEKDFLDEVLKNISTGIGTNNFKLSLPNIKANFDK